MESTALGYEAWLARLAEAELPALGVVVRELRQLTEQRLTSADRLASVLLRDAALTAKVLRVANSSYFNPSRVGIRTLSRAIVLIGFDNVRLIAVSASLIEGLLARASRDQLCELLARAFHAAVQARSIAGYVVPGQQEEVFIAALLHHLGELAFWSCATPEEAERAGAVLVDPLVPVEQGFQTLLGTSFRQLTLGLLKQWDLSELAILSHSPPATVDPAVGAVVLGLRISEAAARGWPCEEIEPLAEQFATLTRTPTADALSQMFASAREAAQVAQSFGAGRISALIPVGEADEVTLQCRLYRPVSAGRRSDPAALQAALEELGTLVRHRGEVSAILEATLRGVHQGLGLERVLLAVLADQPRRFKAREVVGEAADGLRHCLLPFDEQGRSDLFSYVLRHREAFWMGVPASHSLDDLVTPAMRQMIGKGMFFVAPLVAGQRRIGVLYADNHVSGAALMSEQYLIFRQFAHLACLALERLAQPVDPVSAAGRA